MAKEVKKQPKTASSSGGRVRKLSKKQANQKAKKEVKKRQPLPSSFSLTSTSFKSIVKHWKTLGGIVAVYLLLNIVFAGGISNVSSSFNSIKDNLEASGNNNLAHAASGFAGLVGSSGASGSATGSALQSTLFIIESLVIIWALRHLLSGQKITVKQAYYKSMTPLIPFLLVIAVIIIQLLPISIGAAVFAAIASSVFPDTTIASIISASALIVLAVWSFYMVSSSIFGLYIVTLPDMQPRQALRSAKDLVGFRRAAVIRKVLFLPLMIFAAMAIIIVPLILFVSVLVPTVFFVLSMLAILFMHTYLYSFYRSLLE